MTEQDGFLTDAATELAARFRKMGFWRVLRDVVILIAVIWICVVLGFLQ